MKSVFVLLVGFAACGDNLADPHIPHSGDRLKLVRYAYDGDPIEIDRTRFFDSELEQFCTIQTWSDGAHYCTPPIAEAVYANDACTLALGVGLDAIPPPYFATFFELGGTSSISALYRNVTPSPPPAQFWRRRDGQCAGPFYPEDGDGHHYYVVDGPLPVDNLRVKLTTPSARERLGEVFTTTEDGLRIATGIHDHELDLDCRVDGQADAVEARCIPSRLDGQASYFMDDRCATPIMVADQPPTVAAKGRVGTGCVDYYAPTDEVTPAAVYRLVDAQCEPATLPGGTRAYGMSKIEPARLAREPTGTGRVQAITIGDLSLPDTVLHDVELATDCQRLTQLDGQERCIPMPTGTLTTQFADSGCATEIAVALVPERECDVIGRYVRASEVYEIGAAYPGTLYELTTGDRCREFHPPAGIVPHAVGPAIARDRFPQATLVIDP